MAADPGLLGFSNSPAVLLQFTTAETRDKFLTDNLLQFQTLGASAAKYDGIVYVVGAGYVLHHVQLTVQVARLGILLEECQRKK